MNVHKLPVSSARYLFLRHVTVKFIIFASRLAPPSLRAGSGHVGWRDLCIGGLLTRCLWTSHPKTPSKFCNLDSWIGSLLHLCSVFFFGEGCQVSVTSHPVFSFLLGWAFGLLIRSQALMKKTFMPPMNPLPFGDFTLTTTHGRIDWECQRDQKDHPNTLVATALVPGSPAKAGKHQKRHNTTMQRQTKLAKLLFCSHASEYPPKSGPSGLS